MQVDGSTFGPAIFIAKTKLRPTVYMAPISRRACTPRSGHRGIEKLSRQYGHDLTFDKEPPIVIAVHDPYGTSNTGLPAVSHTFSAVLPTTVLSIQF